jgi:hypothetical protein
MYFVSVDSKELSVPARPLLSTLTRESISVDSKRFALHQDYAEGLYFLSADSKGIGCSRCNRVHKKEKRQWAAALHISPQLSESKL